MARDANTYRITINLSPSTGLAIDELAYVTEQSKVSVIRALLDEAAPSLLKLANVARELKKDASENMSRNAFKALFDLSADVHRQSGIIGEGLESLSHANDRHD
ncbi:MAG: hypothetical protein ACYDCW_17570 [Acidithiobacillus ferrivorans]|jgi:predicted transcriptional regulator